MFRWSVWDERGAACLQNRRCAAIARGRGASRPCIPSRGSGILSLYKIADDEAEALEFAVHDNPEFAGKALKDISLKAGVLIAAVIRGKNLVVPNGGTVLKGNDLVILVTTQELVSSLDDVLR